MKSKAVAVDKLTMVGGFIMKSDLEVGTIVQVNGFMGTIEEIDGELFLMVDPTDLHFVDGNRPLAERHVEYLMSLIKKENLLHYDPIKIARHGGIIDGQHRREAAIRLGITKVPVVVSEVFGDGGVIEQAQKLNTGKKNWDKLDFAHSWAKRGNEHYKKFIEFYHKTGVKQNDCMVLLGGKHGGFRTGTFKVRDEKDAYKAAEQLQDFKKYTKEYMLSRFIRAFTSIRKVKGYNHKKMLHKLELYPMRRCPDARTYKEVLQEIYNKRTTKSERLMFVEL